MEKEEEELEMGTRPLVGGSEAKWKSFGSDTKKFSMYHLLLLLLLLLLPPPPSQMRLLGGEERGGGKTNVVYCAVCTVHVLPKVEKRISGSVSCRYHISIYACFFFST